MGDTEKENNQKKPAHPGNKSPERLALNSPFHIPLRRTFSIPPVWPHIILEAFSMTGKLVTSAQLSRDQELSSRISFNSRSNDASTATREPKLKHETLPFWLFSLSAYVLIQRLCPPLALITHVKDSLVRAFSLVRKVRNIFHVLSPRLPKQAARVNQPASPDVLMIRRWEAAQR